jgi:hypothetical protein
MAYWHEYWEENEIMHAKHPEVGHTCNPSYSGGRDGEDHGLRPVRAKSSQDPISTNHWA